MKRPLKILHLEDLPEDAELVARAVKKSDITGQWLHVDNKKDFIKALKEYLPDIIVSDHSLPSFDSHEALKIVREMGIHIPFILVTATVSEEYAVNIIKEGASDYILKDRLQRLPNAIWAALDKYDLEKENRLANEILRSSERKYKLIFESNPMPMWMVAVSTLEIIDVNDAAVNHYDYTKDEFLELTTRDLVSAEDVSKYVKGMSAAGEGLYKTGVWRHKKKDGTTIIVDVIAHDIMYEGEPVKLVLANDVTAKMEAEAELAQQHILQQKLVTETSIKVQEREREEIGKELHDNINQLLAAAKLYLEFAMKKEDLHSERLYKSKENINLAIAEIRKLSQALVAPSLGDVTLLQVIQALLESIRIASSLEIELITDNYEEHAMDADLKLMLYRILQEQMNNILKHSKASKVVVKIGIRNKQVRLLIKDDGVGFDTSKTSSGIGLRNMINRASYYDGITRILSSPGKGCTLEVNVPAARELVKA
ncbi:MAG: response regulator [Chitinophagaceae bacterium]